jgi:hypothetical protein
LTDFRPFRNWRDGLLCLIVILVIGVPRSLALDRYVTADESKWLTRAGTFYWALAHGNLAATFVREHPGVTIMWAGMLVYLRDYPGYPEDAPGSIRDSRNEIILRQHGYSPIQMLAAGRLIVVLLITLVLAIAFWLTVRLVGRWPAALGFLLIGFDPFHLGLTRLLHPDGLMSNLMLLSLLAFLAFLASRRRSDLLISSVAAGLAWLTKSPAFFLAPFVGLLVAIVLAWRGLNRLPRLRAFFSFLIPLLRDKQVFGFRWAFSSLVIWSLVGWLVFFLLWPAMWVNPLSSLRGVLSQAETYADEGHSTAIFFNGQALMGNPGKRFYPINYLWRTTPVVLVGLGLAGLGFFLLRNDTSQSASRWTAAALVLFAAAFIIFMTIGSKKFDRYILPIFAPLDLVAGIGWAMAARWLAARLASLWKPGRLANDARARPDWLAVSLSLVFLVLPVAGQGLYSLPTYPYFLSYYDPWMGGSAKAPQVMMIGWGEGIDQAARYLDAKPNSADLKVMSWYPEGSFSYFFDGETIFTHPEWKETQKILLTTDYVVVYIHQWQRDLPFPKMLKYLSKLKPEHVIVVNGIEYVQIYKIPKDAKP